ncbi:hypothetical protein Dtox_0665 [Desulfofarcimen acetoxidans DSM 771]|uniref:Flagellar protein FliT n=1 Tax=Desulfofarcimen acetoxidans (strain ATCC 49208 / DSM 771 / KCTC 5769 / VKM B-1644 / 5575) TaxID=485916 RepID=C8W1D5_DESAS|nr:hypothetical protein [Desulfofarcimen acetoxidans]ACV61580.1 hypothetical protein Dtox_0665 [Desulfofarcimen acetoxidans DSM 771]
MIEKKAIDRQEPLAEIEKLTVKMLEIIESPEENYEDLLNLLEQRQQAMSRFEQLPAGEINETGYDISLVKKISDLDSQLKEKVKAKHQKLRDAVAEIQRHKASLHLYRKKAPLAEGLFLDNKK